MSLFNALDLETFDFIDWRGDLLDVIEFYFFTMLILDLNETDLATLLFSLSSSIALSRSSITCVALDPSFARRKFEILSLRSSMQVSGSSLRILL